MPKNKSIKTLFNEVETRTTIRHSYKLTVENKSVFLSMIQGDTGQASISSVYLGTHKILSDHIGDITDLEIGKSNDIESISMRVYTLITDVEGLPDMTSFEIILTGGMTDLVKKYK